MASEVIVAVVVYDLDGEVEEQRETRKGVLEHSLPLLGSALPLLTSIPFVPHVSHIYSYSSFPAKCQRG